MSGHSKWSKIKRSKGANDAKRSREWSKLARRIIVAAKNGGGSLDDNLTLRYAVDDAKGANMPKDTIEKAIKKGTGELGAVSYEPAVYEGYGPGGVAFIVDCLTDNRNRTGPDMRKIFDRSGGRLGETNCVGWMFEPKGTFVISAEQADEDTLMEIALEAGADDVSPDGETFEITCQTEAYASVRDALAERGIETVSAELAMVPTTTVTLDESQARKVLNLMESLEDYEDVQNVYANFDMSDEVMEKVQD
jgi:YebC/PmpR family DNA-binding regulatory protein